MHWTQTPAGRKKMSRIMKAKHKAGKFKRGGTPVAMRKPNGVAMDEYVLARRLQKLVNAQVRTTGELTDFVITAHLLCQKLLGQ